MASRDRFRRAEELFHAALQIPAFERDAFLDRRCADDPSLRRQVESLLSEDGRTSGLLEAAVRGERPADAPALSAGARIGPYEILGVLGVGGMGEVYRAQDINLNRVVALKVLPRAFASNPERVRRLRREAQFLASLNHPHIAGIYAVEDSEQGLALIMELVEGPTLAERIRQGSIPFEQTLEVARQIAEALEAAHERGIVHRDLKPANIKFTAEGQVKILDFGIGKALTPDVVTEDPRSSAVLTRTGLILGSAAYMSPEQARGAAIDRRTDVWAFGVLVYEMLSGERPFRGDTPSDTLAAVLTREPDWPRIPAQAQYSLRLCFEKDPQKRLRDIWDAWALLQQQTPPGQSAGAFVDRRVWTALILVLALAFWVAWSTTGPVAHSPLRLARLDIDLGGDLPLGTEHGAAAILSPDGARLVYVSQSKLFTRTLDQAAATELSGTEGAYDPFFSPDGQWVAFFTPGKLKKVSVHGGAPMALCDAGLSSGGSWGEDGSIVAAIDVFGLSRVPAAGGIPAKLTALEPGEAIHRWPQVLPGGGAVLFSVYKSATGLDGARIESVSLKDGRRKIIQRSAGWAKYLASGHLMYLQKDEVLAAPFDLNRIEVRGAPAVALTDAAHSASTGSTQLECSREGTLIYRTSRTSPQVKTVQWLDGSGKTRALLAAPGYYTNPRLSPDGERLAVSSAGDIWVYELRRGTMTRLTFDGGCNNPLWSPDGRFIVFRAPREIRWIRVNGPGAAQVLASGDSMLVPSSFSPDGKRLAFTEVNSRSGADIWTLPIESDGESLRPGKPAMFLGTNFNERTPAFSPDGRRIAYSSDETGILEVYVRNYPDQGGKVQISNGGGNFPVWSPKTSELFLTNGDRNNQLMTVKYAIQGVALRPEKARRWSDNVLLFTPPSRNYDLALDGRHAIAILSAPGEEKEAAERHVVLLQHFFDELQRRVPRPATRADSSQDTRAQAGRYRFLVQR